MKLQTAWNHCTLIANCTTEKELLLNLYNKLKSEEACQKGESILELSKDSSELIISTYF